MQPATKECDKCNGVGLMFRPEEEIRKLQNGELDPTDTRRQQTCDRCGGGGRIRQDYKVPAAVAALLLFASAAYAQPVNMPPGPPVTCNQYVVYDAATNGATQLVALATGRRVYVCGYTIVSGGTVNVSLKYGTGTACATGGVAMSPAYQMVAQTVVADTSSFS